MYVVPDGPNPLTPTEQKIVCFVLAGYTTYGDLVERSGYTIRGVNKILQMIRDKTGARNMADIVIWGYARCAALEERD